MVKLLIGGSPCTYWSVAQSKGREIEASGTGWELFENYLIAKEKFKPDFFLYENNKSASQAIKDKISQELGVNLMHINSALVSAQNRQRFYAFNWHVNQPENRHIALRDVLENAIYQADSTAVKPDCPVCLNSKSGRGGQPGLQPSLADRIYSIDGKATAITTAFHPKIAVPVAFAPESDTRDIFDVKDGLIQIKGEQSPIKLPDGRYVIRRLTPIECERLQTLPDDYTSAVCQSQRYKGLGNGWTAEVIIHILSGALKDVPRDEKIIVLSMYDGIGTGRYCLDKMGFTNVKYYAYEIDSSAITVALSNFQDIIECGDAFDVRKENWNILEEQK